MIQLFDGYLNKFIEISSEENIEIESPIERNPLFIVSEDLINKSYSFNSNKDFQKFYNKYSKTRSLSVFQNKNEYIIFSMDNKSIQNIYAQFNTPPVPYAIFFLNFLKKNKIKDAACLIEIINNQARVITVEPNIGLSIEISSYQSPVMFQNFMRDKLNNLKKKNFNDVKFFIVNKSIQTVIPQSTLLSFDDLFLLEDISSYVFEEPVLKIKHRKNRELTSGIGLLFTSVLLSLLSIFVFNTLKNKTSIFYTKTKQNNLSISKLKSKLKEEEGKRFLYILNNKPKYSIIIDSILSIFPKGAYVKKINISNNHITVIGYTNKSYRSFVRIFNSLSNKLYGTMYNISPIASNDADFRFIIKGVIHES